MSLSLEAPTSADVLTSLRSVASTRGLEDLAVRLAELSELVRSDMKDVELAIDSVPRGDNSVQKSAAHLLALGGKRLRPMCVALASRVGTGFGPAAREVGVAVELVHCATLLHDDVVDVADQRRGAPAARTLYGNAASIFAGDYLLVEALRRVRHAGVPGALERLLGILDEMILAEALQLDARGKLDTREETYFRVVEGKTAALFRWAMYAGGKAGGLDDVSCEALERFGMHLGVGFQVIDDVLDYAGDAAVTGKALFTDLREGKMTHPLLVAQARDPSLRRILEAIIALPAGESPSPDLSSALLSGLHRTGALDTSRALAHEHAAKAVESLTILPDGRAKDALLTVAKATVHREA